MKNTYAPPAVTDRCDAVRTTLNCKPFFGGELGISRGTTFGNNLSFGL
jgi:hypothetical protein